MNNAKKILCSLLAMLLTSCDYLIENEFALGFHDRAAKYGSQISGEINKIDIANYSLKDIKIVTDKYGVIFPERLPCGEAMMFTYSEVLGSDKGYIIRGECYLEWAVPLDTFNNEIRRVSDITIKKEIQKGAGLFDFQSFIAVYNCDSRFEYAIFNEAANTIIYIYFYTIDNLENLVFSNSFKPYKKLNESGMNLSLARRGGLNIYE